MVACWLVKVICRFLCGEAVGWSTRILWNRTCSTKSSLDLISIKAGSIFQMNNMIWYARDIFHSTKAKRSKPNRVNAGEQTWITYIYFLKSLSLSLSLPLLPLIKIMPNNRIRQQSHLNAIIKPDKWLIYRTLPPDQNDIWKKSFTKILLQKKFSIGNEPYTK